MNDESTRQSFEQAIASIRAGDAAGAVEVCRGALSVAPDNIDLLALQGVALLLECRQPHDEWGAIIGFGENCELDVDAVALNDVAAALRSDPAVAAEPRYQYSFAVSAGLNIGGLRTSLKHALAALGAAPDAAGKAAL